jgi:uncharacterized tellurite resistance protein B-like protein
MENQIGVDVWVPSIDCRIAVNSHSITLDKFASRNRTKAIRASRPQTTETTRETIRMDRIELFHSLVNLAASDGKFTEHEIQFLAERAEEWHIPRGEFETALAGLSQGEVELNIPADYADRVEMMKEMLRLIASDGQLAEIEKRICSVVAGKMDFSSAEFERILDAVIREEP